MGMIICKYCHKQHGNKWQCVAKTAQMLIDWELYAVPSKEHVQIMAQFWMLRDEIIEAIKLAQSKILFGKIMDLDVK